LFRTATKEVLERWAEMNASVSAGISDPAERFAVGLRVGWRLLWANPEIASIFAGAGLELLDVPRGARPPGMSRVLRDIQAGQATGRFAVPDAEIALSVLAGGWLGLLLQRKRHPERIDETSVDQFAEATLRFLGVPAPEAARIAALPLPGTGTW
jgi:hypothetical protein